MQTAGHRYWCHLGTYAEKQDAWALTYSFSGDEALQPHLSKISRRFGFTPKLENHGFSALT